MRLTKEQAIEELRYRGLPIPGESEQKHNVTYTPSTVEELESEEPLQKQNEHSSTLTREDAIKELKRRGRPIPGDIDENSYMGRIATSLNENIPGLGKFAEKVNPYFQGFHDVMKNDVVPLAAHGAEGLLNIPISAGNLVPGVNVPHLDYAKYTHPDRESTIPEDIAEFAGGLGGYGKALSVAGKVLPKTSNILGDSRFAKYFSQLMKKGGWGAGAGYTLGEQKGEEGDYLGSGRLIGAGLGAAGGLIHGGLSTAKNYLKTLSPDSIVGNVLKKRKGLYDSAEKVYNKVTSAADNGTLPVKIPNKLQLGNLGLSKKGITKYLTQQERSIVKDLAEKGDYKSAHELQTILREAASRYPKKITTHRDARNAINKTRNSLVKSIDKSLKQKGGDALVNEYKKAGKKYTDYLEYDIKPFKDYLTGGIKKKGSLTKEDFIEALKKNKDFKTNQLKHFPEITERDMVHKYGPMIGKTLGLGGTVGLATSAPSIVKYLFSSDEK